jgi:energy-coupling factor transport system substrate-specific component
VDKGISVLIAYAIYKKIPRRFLSQYATDGKADSDADEEDF